MIPGAGCGDVEQLSFCRHYLVQLELVGDVIDARRQRQHTFIAGDDQYSTEFQSFCEMHRTDEHCLFGASPNKR